MKHSGLCFASLLTGAFVGSAVALLYAPKTGREMRNSIRDFIEKEADKVRCCCESNAD